MGDGTFKHITVTAAEEDDVVIHAGLVPSDDARPEDSVLGELAGEELAAESSMPEEPTLEGPAVEAPSANSTPPAQVPSGARARKTRDDGYRPTTLEDLQGKPMPTIQKAVIIAAIICIIGAIVYYIAFMG